MSEMMNTNQVKSPLTQLKENLGEYQILSNIYKPDLSFDNTFELIRRVKTLDSKTFLLVRKIDPLYESVITNNFLNIEPNKFSSILHRISLLESIINDLNQTIVNYQISF